MNIHDAFPSKFLAASDLKGRELIVTIEKVITEAVGKDQEMKAVVYFQGKQKGVVLNKTNAKRIVEIVGSAQTDDWPGAQIKIYPTETEFGGETVECIRVKAPGRVAAKTTPPPPPEPPSIHEKPLDDSDIPFAWIMPFVLPALLGLGMLWA